MLIKMLKTTKANICLYYYCILWRILCVYIIKYTSYMALSPPNLLTLLSDSKRDDLATVKISAIAKTTLRALFILLIS